MLKAGNYEIPSGPILLGESGIEILCGLVQQINPHLTPGEVVALVCEEVGKYITSPLADENEFTLVETELTNGCTAFLLAPERMK